MVSTYYLSKCNDGIHKYQVMTPTTKKIKFGAEGYNDYIIYSQIDKTKANAKKRAYIARHRIKEPFTSLNKKGTWARYILWNKPTLHESIKNMENKFNIRIALF